jgi:hypothetical protein
MSKQGFFWFLGDGFLRDWRQQQEIEQLSDRGRLTDAIGESHTEMIGQLQRAIDGQAREIATLRVALGVLSKLLVEHGGVDEGVLDARLAEAIAAEPAAQPRRAAKEGAKCENCGLHFPAEQLAGMVCKRCRAIVGE